MGKQSQPLLEIRDLHTSIGGKQILKGLNLSVPAGQSHALMGPNGSGKSTLSYVIMGHPEHRVDSGDILFQSESILSMSTEERARKGIFLSFQHPISIAGVSIHNFLRNAVQNFRTQQIPVKEFRKELQKSMQELQMEPQFAGRYVNDGFSGGEKKRNEILQLTLLKPTLAILDEIDSGLDIDAMRLIANRIKAENAPHRAFLIITHYKRLLSYLRIDCVHVFVDGRIIQSGGPELADRLEKEGYDWTEKTESLAL